MQIPQPIISPGDVLQVRLGMTNGILWSLHTSGATSSKVEISLITVFIATWNINHYRLFTNLGEVRIINYYSDVLYHQNNTSQIVYET